MTQSFSRHANSPGRAPQTLCYPLTATQDKLYKKLEQNLSYDVNHKQQRTETFSYNFVKEHENKALNWDKILQPKTISSASPIECQ